MGDVTILASLVKAVLDAAAAVGLDAGTLAAEAGIDPSALEDPDGRVPLALDIRLWEVLSRQPVGLEIGARLGLEGLGVVGYAMRHGATVGESLEWLRRFHAVVHPEVVAQMVVRQRPEGRTVTFVHAVPPPFLRLTESLYAYAASLVTSLSALSGRPERPVRVAFPLPTPPDARRHERFFHCPVCWGQPAIEVEFGAAMLDRPIQRADPHLFGYLAKRAEALRAALPGDEPFASRVRREVGARLVRGEPRLRDVARHFGVSDRTLRRRLEAEGTTYAALLDEARRERAMILVGDRRLSCSEIAFLLGYAEPAPFFRAFKRWSGLAPSRFRALTDGESPRA